MLPKDLSMLFNRHRIWLHPLLSFLLPCLVRVIPEIVMGYWPAGFDVVTYYAPFISNVRTSGLSALSREISDTQTAPLTYLFLAALSYGIPLNSFLLSKLISIFIYGFFGFTIYWFTRNYFQWKSDKSFLATVIGSLYFVSLRFSWDMWKNTLGLSFFLFALVYAKRKDYLKFTGLFFLCILSHEITVTLLGLVLAVAAVKNVLTKKPLDRRWISVSIVFIFICILVAAYYVGWIRLFEPSATTIPEQLVTKREELTIPYNYLQVGNWYGYGSEWDARVSSTCLMLKLFGPLLPFALLGCFRDDHLDAYVLISILPFISVLLAPTAAIPTWHRLAFLLTIPLTIYAANAVVNKKKLKVFLVSFLLIFALGYVVLPPENAFPFYAAFPTTYKYIPTSMLQNSVSLSDCPNVAESMKWLKRNAAQGSCLLAHESYLGWAEIYAEKGITVIPYNMSSTVPGAAAQHYSKVYLVWWIRNSGWYDWNPPDTFMEINHFGRIAVYEFLG